MLLTPPGFDAENILGEVNLSRCVIAAAQTQALSLRRLFAKQCPLKVCNGYSWIITQSYCIQMYFGILVVNFDTQYHTNFAWIHGTHRMFGHESSWSCQKKKLILYYHDCQIAEGTPSLPPIPLPERGFQMLFDNLTSTLFKEYQSVRTVPPRTAGHSLLIAVKTAPRTVLFSSVVLVCCCRLCYFFENWLNSCDWLLLWANHCDAVCMLLQNLRQAAIKYYCCPQHADRKKHETVLNL